MGSEVFVLIRRAAPPLEVTKGPAMMSSGPRFASVILVLSALAVPSAQQPPAPARKLALVGGMLLDGYEAGPIHHAAILIEGERIVKVGPAARSPIPPDYTVIDTSGRTMMPGMIELHGAPDPARARQLRPVVPVDRQAGARRC